MLHKQIMFLYNINLAFDEKLNPKLFFFFFLANEKEKFQNTAFFIN